MFAREESQQKFVEKCSFCGKTIRRGSMTQWMFGKMACTCGSGSRAPEQNTPVTIVTDSKNQGETTGSPTWIGERYQVQTFLGEGGMGQVYKVQDANLNRSFAVKMLHQELVKDRAAVRRFEEEARAVRTLTHANLVAVYDYGVTSAGAPYLVMDYLEGESLAALISKHQHLPANETIEMFLQVCDGMAHAHGKDVVHRDLKPTNIIVTNSEDGPKIVKVVDFGIAKVTAKRGYQSQSLTRTGEIFGSPFYMSPEQCTGTKLDRRSDIYSLGCVMYEALSGRPPFRGDNPIQTILMHLNKRPEPFNVLLAVPEDLQMVVFRCLEKEPQYRYQGMEDLHRDLEAARDHRPLLKPPKRKKERKLSGVAAIGLAVSTLSALLLVLALKYFSPQAPIVSAAEAWKKLDLQGQEQFDNGQYDAAESSFQQALEISKQDGAKKGMLLSSLLELKDLYLATGKQAKADDLGPSIEQEEGNNKDNATDTINRLQSMTDASTSKPGYLKEHEQELLQLLGQANDTAVTAMEGGDYAVAGQILDSARSLEEMAFGSPSRVKQLVVLRTMHNLAYLEQNKCNFPKAITLYEQALAAEKQNVPQSNQIMAKTLVGLARACIQAGTYPVKLVESTLQNALDCARQAYGPDSQQVAWTHYNIALLYWKSDPRRAANELRTALAIYNSKDEPNILQQALCNELLGRIEDIILNTRKALSALEEKQTKDALYLADTLRDLARQVAPTSVSAAEPLYRRALAIGERLQGQGGDELISDAAYWLGKLERGKRDLPAAESFFKLALAASQNFYGKNSWPSFNASCGLASAYQGQGKNDLARPLLEQACQSLTSLPLPAPGDAASAIQSCITFAQQNDLSQAEFLKRRLGKK